MLLSKVKSFLSDASYYGLSNVLGQLIGFFLIPLYTAYLSPEDYGILTLLGFYTLFYSPFSHLGLNGAMFRFVGFAKSEEEEELITTTALKAVLIFSLITTLFSLVFLRSLENLFLNTNTHTYLFILTVLTAFFSSITQFGISYLRIKRRVKNIFYLNIGNLVFSVMMNIILIVGFNMGLMGIVVTNAVASILFLIAVFIISRLPLNFQMDRTLLRDMLKYGLPNVPHYIQATAMAVFGQYYLNKVVNSTELGLYAVAWKFCLPFQAIVGIVQSSWSAYKFDLVKNTEMPKGVISEMLFLMVSLYVTLYLGTLLVGDYLLIYMADEAFQSASVLLPLLALIPLANAIYFILGTGVAFGKHQYYMPLISLTGTVVSIGTSLLLIADYGSVGSVISGVAGWLSMAVGVYIYGQYLYKLEFYTWRVAVLFFYCACSGIFCYIYTPLLITKLMIVLIGAVLLLSILPGVFKRRIKTLLASRYARV